MIEKNSDLYPNLGLRDIIEILNNKDKNRLERATYALDGVEVVSDLSYKDDDDFCHNFDIYYGKSSENLLPTVINVHGGGLVYGSKELCKQTCIYLAKFGFNVVNINYRLLPDVTLRDQIKDILDGITYIYENARKLNLNPEKFFLTSDSAGSFLTLGAYALMKDENFREIFDISAKDITISRMALISPMTGLVKNGSLALINEAARKDLSNEQIFFTPNILRALKNSSLPPTIIISSEEDFIMSQALGLKNFLDETNTKNKLLDFKKITAYPLGHSFTISHPDLRESKLVIKEISDFFKNI